MTSEDLYILHTSYIDYFYEMFLEFSIHFEDVFERSRLRLHLCDQTKQQPSVLSLESNEEVT